jgi:hypothetical protein
VCSGFALHGGSGITFAGAEETRIVGDIGCWPIAPAAITGEYLIQPGGKLKDDTFTNTKVFSEDMWSTNGIHFQTRFNSSIPTTIPTDLAGQTFTPGTYHSAAGTFSITTGFVTLDGENKTDPVFLFLADTTLITAADTYFVLINGAKAKHVIWHLGTAATLGASSMLAGSILAKSAITVGTMAEIRGCAIAKTLVSVETRGYINVRKQATFPCPVPNGADVCQNYALHARTKITFGETPVGDPSVIATDGYIGISPGTSITGRAAYSRFEGSGSVSTDSSDFATSAMFSHADLRSRRSDETFWVVAVHQIGGQTFTPGTYRAGTAINFALGNPVTLDGLNQENPTWLFQAGTSITTAADSYFILINGAKAENIIWAVGTFATLGADSVIEGSIFAGTAVTMGTNSRVNGCVIAMTAVTIETKGFINSPSTLPLPSSAPNEAPPSERTLDCTDTYSHDSLNAVCDTFAIHAGTLITFAGAEETRIVGDISSAFTGEHLIDGNPLNPGTSFLFYDKMWKLSGIYDSMANTAPSTSTIAEIGGQTFTPGTYHAATFNIAEGTVVTLDGEGQTDPVFLFRADTTLITAADTYFILKNGAKAKNIIWHLGSAATLGARSTLEGSILAFTAITFGTMAELRGCAIAKTAVTASARGYINVQKQTNNAHPACPNGRDGVCSTFAVHARTAITFAGKANPSVIGHGDISVSPGTSITGLKGSHYKFDGSGTDDIDSSSFASTVMLDHADLRSRRSDEHYWGVGIKEIGGMTINPGTYRVGEAINIAAGIGNVVTLDGLNQVNPAPTWLFQAGSTLTTAARAHFILINGAKAENVIWALGTAATLGADSVVEGSILAGSAITMGNNARVNGCAIAMTAVTFETEGFVYRSGYE